MKIRVCKFCGERLITTREGVRTARNSDAKHPYIFLCLGRLPGFFGDRQFVDPAGDTHEPVWRDVGEFIAELTAIQEALG